jgi:pimeloyl-ACP methyl ester carboxylesterase
MGAAAAAVLAAEHPGLVGHLVLLDPPWTGDGRSDAATAAERTERLDAWARHVGGLTDDELVALGATEHPDWHPDDLAPWYEAKRQLRPEAGSGLELPPWPDTVDRLATPTLLLCGEPERGGIVTPRRAAEVAARNPLVETVRLGGTGHNLHREDLAATLTAVLAFLDR